MVRIWTNIELLALSFFPLHTERPCIERCTNFWKNRIIMVSKFEIWIHDTSSKLGHTLDSKEI